MAATRVVASSKLQHRLVKAARDTTEKVFIGILLGRKCGDEVHVISCASCVDTSPEQLKMAIQATEDYLPVGIEPVGVYLKTGQSTFPAIVIQILSMVIKPEVQTLFGVGKLLVWAIDSDGSNEPVLYWYAHGDAKVERTDFSYTDKSYLDHYLTFRVKANLHIAFEFSSKIGLTEIQKAFRCLRDEIQSDVSVYHIENSDIMLQGEQILGTSDPTVAPSMPLGDLFHHIHVEGEKETKKMATEKVIQVNQLLQMTGDKARERTIGGAPIINHDHYNFEHVKIDLPIDLAVLADPSETLSSLSQKIQQGTCRQLSQTLKCVIRNSNLRQFCTPEPFYFRPSEMDHLIHVMYPLGISEGELENERKRLHKRFVIDQDRPVFKRVLAVRFPGDVPSDAYLRNTHIGLPPSGVKDGLVSVVSGDYSYHHYMQDRMDDNGWGCAYRSLQTLVSWFRHQGYTDVTVPTHKEIQQTLVDIGDKEPSFVGSRKWIGSTEVSFVLDQLLGVTSKILFVSSGAELASKGRELAVHFQTQGSPVMIGGGVLAHTILGVDFNEMTGEVKFLILDPHYTGAEDLKVIQDKGWCGWKGPDFWDQTAYYNMCMPQRPAII